MEVVSSELLGLLSELQSMESLRTFALAGGTNLSIRYNHRESIDIDLFSNQLVGVNGLGAIESEIREKLNERVLYLNIEDPGCGDQYCFIKSLIRNGELDIKVEILQNIQLFHPVEFVNNFRLISVTDIGMMKLESLSSRNAQKDVYDLDTITDKFLLEDLIDNLRLKKDKFKETHHKSLFDLDGDVDPIGNPLLLLQFDDVRYRKLDKRLSHSNDLLKINTGHKKWPLAKLTWRRKVYKYCKHIGIEMPPIKPLN